MAKVKTRYICTSCETVYPAWQGKCSNCGEWNTIIRDTFSDTTPTASKSFTATDLKAEKLTRAHFDEQKLTISTKGLNKLLGGGLVKGQVVLFAGEPGIGKSTLLTQLCINSQIKILYISGEESLSQLGQRASRLANEISFNNADFSDNTNLDYIVAQIDSKNFDLVIIDSIQTVQSEGISGFPGSMNQIRECANYITQAAKRSSTAVIIVGQITKEGSIAGPKLLEHMVDTVLYFEGDRKDDTRILKVTKNRFGATNEIAIYEMVSEGLREIEDAESYFIEDILVEEGVAYTMYQEGNLSMILEIQALVTKTSFAYPKRVSTGYDSRRLEMLIAILSKKLNLKLEFYDIYVNVVGGIKVDDTSADLAVAVAIISSLKSKAVPVKACFIGELSLNGEIRNVSKLEQRLERAKKKGFTNAVSREKFKTIQELAKEYFSGK